MNKSQKKRKRYKASPILLVIIGAIIISLIVLPKLRAVNRTILLNHTEYTTYEDCTGYMFMEEDYITLESDTKINFLVEEGAKISPRLLLADNYKVRTNSYITEKLNTVNYILENSDSISPEQIYSDMQHIIDKIAIVQKQLDNAIDDKNSDRKDTLLRQYEELSTQFENLKNLLAYATLSTNKLQIEKDNLNALLTQTEHNLTAQNINFTINGVISYSKDGYEDVLNIHNIGNISDEFIENIDDMKVHTRLEDNEYFIKSSQKDETIIVLKLPIDAEIQDEYEIIKRKMSVTAENELTTGYYDFIYKRADIKNLFPTCTMTIDDATIHSHIIDIVYSNEYKYALLFATNPFELGSADRIFDATLELNSYKAYIIPSSSISTENGETYIHQVSGSSYSKAIKVVVHKYDNGNAILKVSQNPNLYNDIEILTRGEW